MKTHRIFPAAVSAALIGAGMAACADDTPASNSMSFEFEAATSESGNCTPKRVVRAEVEDSGLHAIRGETKFILPSGTTEIPFQAVFRGFNDEGMSRDRATSMLNYDGSCEELTIDITIEFCEYYGDDGREKRACPEIELTGDAGFAAINIQRDDQSE
ncbi:MAG: hypothetical protein AAFN07_16710 [Pseudomonadota bacterium]